MKPVSQVLPKIAHSNELRVPAGTTVFDALALLARFDVGALMVFKDGQLVGMFSERDYTRKIALQGKDSRSTVIDDIMTREVISIDHTARTREVMALMSAKRIRHVPVLRDGQVVGLLSIRDLMDDIIADHEQTIEQLQHYIAS
jgi:CBS domain-containing protein